MFGSKKDKEKKQEKAQAQSAPAPLSAAERARREASARPAPQPTPAPQPAPRPAPVTQAAPQTSTQASSQGEAVPAVLGAAVALLLETCLGKMQDIGQLRAGITGAGFRPEPLETARSLGRALALDTKIVTTTVQNMQHAAFSKEHLGVPAVMLMSMAQSEVGGIVFCSAMFGGATEAEAVRVVERIIKTPVSDGGLAHDADGNVLRRIFWKLGGAGGLQAIVLSGPEDVASRDVLRGLTAIARTNH